MNHQYFSFWRNNHKLTTLVMGVLFVITTFPAYAEFKPLDRRPANQTTSATSSQITFRPRDRKAASGNSRAGGSRGGCASNGIPLTLLAPKTFVGKTASTRPMLAWYMSSSQTVRFGLFELQSGTPKRIGKPKEIPAIIGINKLKLPLDYPELTVGKTYLWQISLDCEKDTIVNRVEFTVTQSLPDKRFTRIEERVNYYGENGLWYEALEEALKETSNGKLSRIGSKLVQNLAQFDNLGTEANPENTKQRIENLRKISVIN